MKWFVLATGTRRTIDQLLNGFSIRTRKLAKKKDERRTTTLVAMIAAMIRSDWSM
jgi:hypothetical protein